MSQPSRRTSFRWLATLALPIIALSFGSTRSEMHASSQRQDVLVPSGWNVIADPYGAIPTGPAYTFQIGDSAYEVVQPGTPLVPGLGYWVYAANVSGVPLPSGNAQAVVRADAGRWVMIGDPSGQLPAQVSGADLLMTYDPRTGFVAKTDATLVPGQAAFALSQTGGEISIVAQGTASSAPCSTSDPGSACPSGGSCPAGYPVSVTQDWSAHPAVQSGDPSVQGTPILCFNDLSQATAAGYRAAPPARLTIDGPVSATAANIRITVLHAILETPDAFLAGVQAAGQQLCSSCNLNGATAVLAIDYSLENLDRPPTSVATGMFISSHYPTESSSAYGLLAGQTPPDPVHEGFPVTGSLYGVFTHTKFSDIDTVDWQLLNPLTDTSSTLPQPHGPSISFALSFSGANAGQIIVSGDLGASPPVPCFATSPLYPCFNPAVPAPGISPFPPQATPAPSSTPSSQPVPPTAIVPIQSTPFTP